MGKHEVQIIGVNSGKYITFSKSKKITDNSWMSDMTADEAGDFWVAVYDGLVIRVP